MLLRGQVNDYGAEQGQGGKDGDEDREAPAGIGEGGRPEGFKMKRPDL